MHGMGRMGNCSKWFANLFSQTRTSKQHITIHSCKLLYLLNQFVPLQVPTYAYKLMRKIMCNVDKFKTFEDFNVDKSKNNIG